MFRRVVLQEWHTTLAAIAFGLVAGVFLLVLIRTALMKGDAADRMANLPLEDQPSTNHGPSHE